MTEQISTTKDKTTVGVTSVGQDVLDSLINRKDIFSTESGAFKSAVALAIDLDLTTQETRTSFSTTKWNAGSLTDLVDFVRWYLDTDSPVRKIETLGDAGLRYIAEKVSLGESIDEIFDIEEYGEN